MKLLTRGRSALIAFVLFDLALVLFLVDLYRVSDQRESITQLRELGVTIYPQPRVLSNFALQDQSGNNFGKSNLVDVWSLVFFGFTSCPDICPLTMVELEQFYRALDAEDAQKIQIVLATVDPARDTPQTMERYLENYHEDFIGLSGDAPELSSLAEQLYVVQSGGPKMEVPDS